mmetsp:Transcript_4802/g.8265  ORF Transcript_4802/g.8265 Transcript_4802/m.8265 type:complete len:417 (+) Transcript_4802:334-1584(+)
MGLTTNEQGVLDKKWKIQALKTVQASLKEQLNLRETNPKINKRLQELHRMQTLSAPKETQIFARFRTVGCVGSVLCSVLMALALAFFVLRDVVKVESSGELGEIPVPAGQGDDFEAQGSEGWTLPNNKGSAVPAAVEDYNGRDILNAKTDDSAEDGEDDPAEDGDDAPASDNDQKGGFDEVYQEVIKPLDADALPEGAGLLPPQETATGVSEADETLNADEGKDADGNKEGTASKKTGKAGKSAPVQDTKERAKLQQTIMKAHPQTLSIAKKDPSPNGVVTNEPADFTAQSEKSPKDWPKKIVGATPRLCDDQHKRSGLLAHVHGDAPASHGRVPLHGGLADGQEGGGGGGAAPAGGVLGRREDVDGAAHNPRRGQGGVEPRAVHAPGLRVPLLLRQHHVPARQDAQTPGEVGARG